MVRNRPIITRGGRWVLPAYVQSIYQSQFWLSDDQGETWRPTEALFTLPNNLQPAVQELGDGYLLALLRSGEGGPAWQACSGDHGETWLLCRRADLPNPNSGLDFLRLAGGSLVVAYNHSTTERTPLVVRASLDGGETWRPPKMVEDGAPQLSYPCLTQSADGVIHLVYSHRLDYIRHADFNLAWVLAP